MNIAIMGCEQIKDEACIGCQRCLTAMHRREGELERYKDDPEARIVAIFHCGGCPGTSPVLRMKQLQSWMSPMGETVDVVHLHTVLVLAPESTRSAPGHGGDVPRAGAGPHAKLRRARAPAARAGFGEERPR
jgi:predicted metal-binding protein